MMSARAKARLRASVNRRELISAGFSRRDLVKMGLVTAAGTLLPKNGLSARALSSAGEPMGAPASPVITPFVEPVPPRGPSAGDPYVIQRIPSLTPAPTAAPNTTAGEGRTLPHQTFGEYVPVDFYEMRQQQVVVKVSPDLPDQTLWGFNGMTPGPTFVSHYGRPALVRNYNELPPKHLNGGFGLPSVSTHLHNGHTPAESDGNPCLFFGPYETDDRLGNFYDYHYPNVLAGCNSTHAPNGDMDESMSTLWYHDHRVDFTAQNTYKGLAGFYLVFNQFDTGDEMTGFRLPSGAYDQPLMFTDKVIDTLSGQLFFDLFNLDGIIGDTFLVNGKVQPFMEVSPRRYRFRLLDAGPSRFYQFHLTDPSSLTTKHPFWHIANDGNLLPQPVLVNNVRLSVAERMDIIIDFSKLAGKTIYLENRLEQEDGRGPTKNVLPAGQGNYVLQFKVTGPAVQDDSADPATAKYYNVPYFDAAHQLSTPRVTRRLRFERENGMWAINDRFVDCERDRAPRFKVQRNSCERWVLQNNSGGWQHPIHIHFEEFQIVSRNGVTAPPGERGRKDVLRLQFNEEVVVDFRFRDFLGRYPLHCHNTVHEDHAMMLLWELAEEGDLKTRP